MVQNRLKKVIKKIKKLVVAEGYDFYVRYSKDGHIFIYAGGVLISKLNITHSREGGFQKMIMSIVRRNLSKLNEEKC